MPQTPESSDQRLSHIRDDGSAQMVDVGQKAVTERMARAAAQIFTTEHVLEMIFSGGLPKGDALVTARVAGILAAKQTQTLIPLCHTVPLNYVGIEFARRSDSVAVVATAKTSAKTGVEMEALSAVTVAALTIYDMIKAVDKHPTISEIRVIQKTGGRSGDWRE